MSSVYARAPIDSPAASILRISLGAAILASLVTLWSVLRPGIYQHIARVSLGNIRFCGVTFYAIAARYPELQLDQQTPTFDEWAAWSQDWTYVSSCWTYDAPRASGAVVLTGDQWRDGAPSQSLLFDEHLVLTAKLGTNLLRACVRDRDGVPGAEAVGQKWGRPVPSDILNIVISIGTHESTILAVVGSPSEDMVLEAPVWTNSDGDARDELEWLEYRTSQSSPFPEPTSVFRLYWREPGVLAHDGQLPPGYQVWLAPPHGGVRVPEDESIDRIATQLLDGRRTSPLPP